MCVLIVLNTQNDIKMHTPQMLIARNRALGPPEVVSIEKVPIPTPQKGQIFIRIHTTTVSTADGRSAKSKYPQRFRNYHGFVVWVQESQGSSAVQLGFVVANLPTMLKSIWISLTQSKKVIVGLIGENESDLQYLLSLCEKKSFILSSERGFPSMKSLRPIESLNQNIN